MEAFPDFTSTEIDKHVKAAQKEYSDDYKSNVKFLNGDHWQGGDGWAGALPGDSQKKQEAVKKIKELFTSQNVMKEVARRHKSAVIGKEPSWSIDLKRALGDEESPKDSEQEAMDEIEAAISEWWKDQEVHEVLEEWLMALLKSARAVLRIYVPSQYLSDNGTIETGGDLSEQLKKIRIEVVDPDKGAVVENKEQGSKAGILSFKDDEDNEIYEISYLDEDELTVIKNLSDETDPEGVNLGGHLSIYEGQRDLFLTEQVRQQNKLVNKAFTMMSNNVDSGFLERVFLNAQAPGEWKEDDETGEETFVPAPYKAGPGTTNFINPIITEDEDGKTQALGNANVKFREPVTNESFAEAKEEAYRAILEEVQQKHALITGDATASGESRIQALEDFIKDVRDTKSTIDKAGVWLIETIMYLAGDFSNNNSYPEEYKATFNCRIDPGNIPAELRDKIIKQYNEGLLSRETAMAMLGVDDIESELSKIDSASDDALETLRELRNADVRSATLNKKLVEVIIDDKEWLADALEDGDKKTIFGEIEDQINQQVQQSDIFPGAN